MLVGGPVFAGTDGAFGLTEDVSATATTKPDVVARVFRGLV